MNQENLKIRKSDEIGKSVTGNFLSLLRTKIIIKKKTTPKAFATRAKNIEKVSEKIA